MKKNDDYKQWLMDLKNRIRKNQIKAAIAVNSALIEFYWDLGKMIAEKQTEWGSKFLATLSDDLRKEFPDIQGLSERNLKYCRTFYQFYENQLIQQVVGLIGQQPVAQLQAIDNKGDTILQQVVEKLENHLIFQIPWGHHIQIFTKSKSVKEALFYVQKTIENNWSRDTLALQIEVDVKKCGFDSAQPPGCCFLRCLSDTTRCLSGVEGNTNTDVVSERI